MWYVPGSPSAGFKRRASPQVTVYTLGKECLGGNWLFRGQNAKAREVSVRLSLCFPRRHGRQHHRRSSNERWWPRKAPTQIPSTFTLHQKKRKTEGNPNTQEGRQVPHKSGNILQPLCFPPTSPPNLDGLMGNESHQSSQSRDATTVLCLVWYVHRICALMYPVYPYVPARFFPHHTVCVCVRILVCILIIVCVRQLVGLRVAETASYGTRMLQLSVAASGRYL